MTLSRVHSISQLPKRSRNFTALQICTTLQNRSIGSEEKGRGADSDDVSCCTSTPVQAVTVLSLWYDSQIPTGQGTSPSCYHLTNFWNVTRSQVSSTLSQYGVMLHGNVTSVDPALPYCVCNIMPVMGSLYLMYVCVCVYIYTHTHTHTYICVYIYIYIYIFTKEITLKQILCQ